MNTNSTVAQTLSNLNTMMTRVSNELSRVFTATISLTGEIFIDNTADRIWFKVWNEEANTTHWVAEVPEDALPGETLVAVDDTTEALMYR